MNVFPKGMNASYRYDVVFIGNVVPKYNNSGISNLLYNDYVFLFTTALNKNENSYWYGHVDIDIVRHDHLSYFNRHLKEQGRFHVLENEKLILNNFLEIDLKETEKGVQIIAHLKKQNILGEDEHSVKMVKDFRVLLLRENKNERFDNYPILELGTEFQAEIDLAQADQRYHALSETSFMLQELGNRNQSNPEVINAIEVAQAALNKDIDDTKIRQEQEFERCLDYIRCLSYKHKRTHFN